MKNFLDDGEDFEINGFKHFSELAMEYFPNYASSSAARKRMQKDIEKNKALKAELEAAHYTPRITLLSPEMQRIIYKYWGLPKIRLSGKKKSE
ncbi:DUF4248 domain-containing protein [Bacteroides pyogenes]|uniref:DUF4248 domain-containing protein n=2 Tax=Bacteroides pyogenes TaxID=310300 RepID=A0A5D3EA90_9BACE|nr:DUF4248 domain-containing protein [Bacteroides pyogenes]MBR8705520.1 hypothetical protein [Bacteroides pyogenes]MBR8709559.1 hypothetical protein [Bacteroides pyogenes]MBR8718440.1 hypothetical protein [Bacteroides pyogenes]MBR8726592.1 hypothetical protein [Bacteroides pyogenes]MBR8739974.1 hypothetical protein [Bacteroides pyogenes]